MIIEKVNYSHLLGRTDLRDGSGEFNMVVTYPGGVKPLARFTHKEFIADKKRLEGTPVHLRSFIVGTFTALYDPQLRHLPDEYRDLIETVHNTLEDLGIDTYSCFRREAYGRKRIRNGYATILDKLALDTSHFLTVLPGASNSEGTWKEINHATRAGKDLVGLFKEGDPEMDFRTKIMEAAAAHGAKSGLVFITFANIAELTAGLSVVMSGVKGERIVQ